MYSSFILKKRVQYKRCRHIYQYISIGQLILIKDYSRSNLPEWIIQFKILNNRIYHIK